MEIRNMNTVSPGESFIIQNIQDDCSVKKRLSDLGITKGAVLQCLFAAPFGDPIAYRVSDAVLALRKKDTAKIEVNPLE